jgi:hypothetical protein
MIFERIVGIFQFLISLLVLVLPVVLHLLLNSHYRRCTEYQIDVPVRLPSKVKVIAWGAMLFTLYAYIENLNLYFFSYSQVSEAFLFKSTLLIMLIVDAFVMASSYALTDKKMWAYRLVLWGFALRLAMMLIWLIIGFSTKLLIYSWSFGNAIYRIFVNPMLILGVFMFSMALAYLASRNVKQFIENVQTGKAIE